MRLPLSSDLFCCVTMIIMITHMPYALCFIIGRADRPFALLIYSVPFALLIKLFKSACIVEFALSNYTCEFLYLRLVHIT